MTQRVYVFTAPMPGGPWRKVFTDPTEFGEYVLAWREDMGPVDWVDPFVARGAM